MEAAKLAQGYDTAAYLCWLGVRLMKMHRILVGDGSIYLHCDHTAGAWIRTLMDAVFGRENFRNEIVWHHPKIGIAQNQFTSNTDILLFYSKSDKWNFAPQKGDNPNELANRWARKLRGNQLYYREAKTIQDSPARSKIRVLEAKLGRTLKDTDVVVDFTHPDNMKAVDNVWKIPFLKGNAHESTGWSTQKPLALYERIILASSNPGDIVFDPFARCSTTLVAAEKHGREWLGCDRDLTAKGVVQQRLSDNRQLANPAEVRLLYDVPIRTDDELEAAPNLVIKPRRPKDRALPRAELLRLLITRDGLLCQGCGLHPVEGLPEWKLRSLMHIDHKMPRAEGGSSHESNRVLLCSDCNLVKSDSMTLIGLRKYNRKNNRMLGRTKEY